MENAQPFEVIGAALTVFYAPVGTAFPDVDETPAIEWIKVGSSGPLNYDDDGIEVEHPQSFNFWRSLGEASSRKAFRTEEDLMIRLTLVDLTLEQYRLALNRNAITTTPAGLGVPGKKKVGLSRGLTVDTMALLVRGPSPYMFDGTAQYEVPIAAQIGSPTVVYQRREPAGLELEWRALVDPSQPAAEFLGRFVAQTAVAL